MTHITLSAIYGPIDKPLNNGVVQYGDNNSPWPMFNLNNRLKGKTVKMLSHTLHSEDVHIWIDGTVKIVSEEFKNEMIRQLGDADIVIQPHPERSSIYGEADFIKQQLSAGSRYLTKRYTAEAIDKQLDFIGEGMEGLYACGVFARRNSEKVNRAFEEWYILCTLFDNFDQMLFVYIVQKHKLKVNNLDLGNFYKNDYIEFVKHLVLC